MFFDERLEETRHISVPSMELVEQVRALTMRGGKRLRPVVVAAAFSAVAPDREVTETVELGAALELLQSFLLIHDDWMDQDEERRGGPAVHVAFRGAHPDHHVASSLGILAGDLASTYAWELFLQTPFPDKRRAEALAGFLRLQKEVYFGQHLDVTNDPDVPRMHRLKTGSYTVSGPTHLGALLGDACTSQLEALERWSAPLGEAFQLRDDLLSTFGDASQIGKPGNDLRNGKRNSLVAEAERRLDPVAMGPISRVMGSVEATEVELEDALALLESSGARAAVETRLEQLTEAAEVARQAAPLDAAGADRLRAVAARLVARTH